MTIIKPVHKKKYTALFMIITVGTVAAGAFYVWQYNALAKMRYGNTTLAQEITELKKEISEVGDKLFSATDPAALKAFAEREGLIFENNPTYIQIEETSFRTLSRAEREGE